MRATLGFFALAAVAACTTTATTPPVIADFGIYETRPAGPTAVARTTRIPARPGTVFGVTVDFATPTGPGLRYRWTFPEMRNPATGDTRTELTGAVEPGTTGSRPFVLRFNAGWEAVPGTWTFRLERDETEMLRQPFEVVSDYD